MAESDSHKRAKGRAPGKSETPLRGRKRLDSGTDNTAYEIERNKSGLGKAVSRLQSSGRPRKVLQVPQSLMKAASEEMKRQGVPGTVKNMGDTKRLSIRKR